MCRYAVRIIPKCCPDVAGISVRMRPKYANRLRIYNGLEYLNLFIQDLYKITLDMSILPQYIDKLEDIFNRIITGKTLERYSTLKLFGRKGQNIDICETIINLYTCVRGIICKYKLSLQYDYKSFEKSVEKLIKIFELEKCWYDYMFSLCEA